MTHPSLRARSTSRKVSGGISNGHAYSVIGVFGPTASAPRPGMDSLPPLVYLRNPWGEQEWTGRYCHKDKSWETVPIAEKARVSLVPGPFFWKNAEKRPVCGWANPSYCLSFS
jgi:hypothetical protein